METIKIAILDSGIKKEHKEFVNKKITALTLSILDDKVIENEYCEDEIGHGTAVHYLIDKLTDKKEIYDFKIMSNQKMLKLEDLELILEYINNYKTKFDIINISLGIVQCDDTSKLQEICDKIYAKGTIIVAAFDNNGAISFPAALNNVIGVDGSTNLATINDFIYIENSAINVIGKNYIQKVAWTNPEYNMNMGNSFTCCYVTAKIVKMLQENNYKLKNISNNKISNNLSQNMKCSFPIKKVAIFPFNKEIHSIARYEELLSFKITGYYSTKETGQVGRTISSILPNCNNDSKIQDVDLINWAEIDTLILGHLNELNLLLKKNYKKILLDRALENNVNIFSFDKLDEYIPYEEQKSLNIYTPRICKDHIQNNFGKLYITNKPIVSVVGTSSSQGKFTLQLYLRKKLIELGYVVGQIGTEPTSELFGIDFAFPIGYNSSVNIFPQEYLQVVNKMIWDLSYKNEIILTGSQSSLAAYSTQNIKQFPFNHQIFLESIQPDVVVLCINPFDETDFIDQTLSLIKGLTSAKVIGAICFPQDIDETWAGSMGRKVKVADEKRNFLKRQMLEKFKLRLGFLDRTDELDSLIEDIINYFANS